MAKDDYRAKRKKETARLSKYEKGTGESTSKVDNAILGSVASTMGLRGLGKIGGAMKAGRAVKTASAAGKATKSTKIGVPSGRLSSLKGGRGLAKEVESPTKSAGKAAASKFKTGSRGGKPKSVYVERSPKGQSVAVKKKAS